MNEAAFIEEEIKSLLELLEYINYYLKRTNEKIAAVQDILSNPCLKDADRESWNIILNHLKNEIQKYQNRHEYVNNTIQHLRGILNKKSKSQGAISNIQAKQQKTQGKVGKSGSDGENGKKGKNAKLKIKVTKKICK